MLRACAGELRRWRLPPALGGVLEQRRRSLAQEADPDQDLVTVAALATATDPAAWLRDAHEHLTSTGGRLLLFEPYRRPHLAGVVADVAAPLVRALTGLVPNLPVPALVRQSGFVIETIERVPMPTSIAPLRSFCLIFARPATSCRVACRATARP